MTVFGVTVIWVHAAVLVRVYTEETGTFPMVYTRLPFNGDVHEARGAQRVDLRHTMGGNVFGIYHCGIATNAVHGNEDISIREAVYVGLYINGGNDGSIALKCFIIIVYR